MTLNMNYGNKNPKNITKTSMSRAEIAMTDGLKAMNASLKSQLLKASAVAASRDVELTKCKQTSEIMSQELTNAVLTVNSLKSQITKLNKEIEELRNKKNKKNSEKTTEKTVEES